MADAIEGQERREQIISAAEERIRSDGNLSFTMNDIANDIGVSRSLLYVYFESVPEIIDAAFLRHAATLEERFETVAAAESDCTQRLLNICDVYLDHVIAHGAIIFYVLRERNLDSPLGPKSVALFRRLLKRMASNVRDEFKMSPRAAFVLLELLIAMPESLARLVRKGEIGREVAVETSDRLVRAALDAMHVRAT